MTDMFVAACAVLLIVSVVAYFVGLVRIACSGARSSLIVQRMLIVSELFCWVWMTIGILLIFWGVAPW